MTETEAVDFKRIRIGLLLVGGAIIAALSGGFWFANLMHDTQKENTNLVRKLTDAISDRVNRTERQTNDRLDRIERSTESIASSVASLAAEIEREKVELQSRTSDRWTRGSEWALCLIYASDEEKKSGKCDAIRTMPAIAFLPVPVGQGWAASVVEGLPVN